MMNLFRGWFFGGAGLLLPEVSETISKLYQGEIDPQM
jgi:hypothetical protein